MLCLPVQAIHHSDTQDDVLALYVQKHASGSLGRKCVRIMSKSEVHVI